MQRPWLSLAFALVAHGDLGTLLSPPFDAVAEAAVAHEAPRYDALVQRTVHNAYARTEPLVDQLAWHGVRSLELDVHTTRRGRAAPPGDFFVFHADVPFARDSSCATLSACLAQVRAFHDLVPDHDVITLFVDLKDAPAGTHDAAALDALVIRELGGEGAVLTPRELLARCDGASSLRAAVTGRCGFPRTDALRGRFVVVTTGGRACDARSPVTRYAGSAPADRAAFVAPDADASCPVRALDAPEQAHVVFVNLVLDERDRAREVRARGLVARVYGGGVLGGLDTPRELAAARASGAQFLATNAVNAQYDPWTLTGLAGAATRLAFIPAPSTASSDERVLEALVATPRSHADRRTRGCLVATSHDAASPDVTLCRSFAGGAPRLEVGGAARAARDVPAEAALLRLRLEPIGEARTRLVGEASVDRRTWREVGATVVAANASAYALSGDVPDGAGR